MLKALLRGIPFFSPSFHCQLHLIINLLYTVFALAYVFIFCPNIYTFETFEEAS